MDDEIKVLDKGYVRLVDYMGGDRAVVDAARVSHDHDREQWDLVKDPKLIRYLLANNHSSPFEHVTLTFEVKAPIFIVRQWHRHRTHSYNEVSARYTEVPDEYYVPDPAKIGTQSKTNKQARDLGTTDTVQRAEEVDWYKTSCNLQFQHYNRLLDSGWPRELARMVLPLSTYTRFYDTVSLWNLFHFIKLRIHPHSQWEMQQYAHALCDLIEPVVPISYDAFFEMLPDREVGDRNA